MPDLSEIPVPTANWSVPFGAMLAILGSMQFGEALYTFLDIQQSVDSDHPIYQLALKQLVLTVLTVFLGIMALVFWKMDEVSRFVVKLVAVFGLALYGFSLYMYILIEQSIDMSPDNLSDPEKLFVRRCKVVKWGNLVLMTLVFFFSLILIWNAAFNVK